ncbi:MULTISPECIES: OsmC family protein [unclassified Siphonobacter]|uniref:OsmC family protein n=1 Tax=unclassified Siphonobacter TaxID=2635712 RepID=UPI000CB93476|nr:MULTISPECIES: OsmC family protein [unclassified Siphonobacter]MDQ1088689.1 putative redox protein [Siphonobacter sp. SORGH_AS_1065]MDR6194834.1 putative redox protein [Siphonobacter sp. SORGH_AS_0500]PKK38574.1 osmotically inducible protein OsmC [Siphonobacter sp. SORGH_AS_0500]
MATATITYLGQLRTQATHVRSGSEIITDAPVDNHGKGEAFSPTDLVASALGSCMLTIMGIVAQRDQVDITGTQVEVTKSMAENPRRISEIAVKLIVKTSQPLTETRKKKLENAALTCPVAESLHPDLVKAVTFEFVV